MKAKDPAVLERLAYAISLGAPRQVQADYAGVSVRTLERWITRANQGHPDYEKLTEVMRQAESFGAIRNLEVIDQAAQDGKWQAAQWWLERKYPKDFGKVEHQILEHRSPFSELSDSELDEEIRKRLGDPTDKQEE